MGDEMRRIDVGGVTLHVEDSGQGRPVLLLHGWPDSARVWRHQVPALVAHGFRVVAPDLPGLGRSDLPGDPAAYRIRTVAGQLVALLDTLGIDRAAVVGHDFGAAVAWVLAMTAPDRVERLAVLSAAHPLAPKSMRQHEMAWYQLLFQFEGVAEETITYDDWRWFREFTRGDGDVEQAIADLSRPGALSASLNWYRTNLAPHRPSHRPQLPPVRCPTLGIWSTRDHYLDGEPMRASEAFVEAEWRYAEVEGASHWLQLDAPDQVNALLLNWLGSSA